MKQLILISALAAACIAAQTITTGSLEGTVSDDENFLPIADATIALVSTGKKRHTSALTTTNSDGYFKMDGIDRDELWPGKYVLIVTHRSFVGQREYFDTAKLFDSRGPALFSFQLKPIGRLTKDFPEFMEQPLP